MAEQIALIEAPIRETTGEPGPRVVHEVCRFEVMGGTCLVLESHAGDLMELRLGRRTFAISLTELAATAAIAVEGHIKGEIRARVIASRRAPPVAPVVDIPVRGTIEADGFITLVGGQP